MKTAPIIAIAMLVACKDNPTENETGNPTVSPTEIPTEIPTEVPTPFDDPSASPQGETTIDMGDEATFTISGLSDDQAYRITLVHADNITVDGNGGGMFIDGDNNGAADAGASEEIALITQIDALMLDPGAKTFPPGDDDPAMPSGIFPDGGEIELVVTGMHPGTVYPVIYHNGGDSTFLEIDDNGDPVETYTVGGAVTVEDRVFTVAPDADATIDAGAELDVNISGLDPAQAYRVTLVVEDNISPGPLQSATFIDVDLNGAADAGPSEQIAGIVSVNGTAQAAAKTVPAGDDDPANPTGVFPDASGNIDLVVQGISGGAVHPVAYVNGGSSTFLEIDGTGAPIEPYAVGGAIQVEDLQPLVMPDVEATGNVGDTVDYTISGLNDLQAYRITLVDANNLTPGLGQSGVFVDNDANGAADAGPSENIAVITTVNGGAITPSAKTVPAGDDDPAAPSGVFPVAGSIDLTVQAVGTGSVYPVVYHNGGMSTFLEIDATGAPIEVYAVGGAFSVTP